MFRQDSKSHFDALYTENHRLVRSAIYNMVGEEPLEDLTQEAFLKIWNGLPQFSFRSSVKTWIYKVAMNVAIDHLRKKKLNTRPITEDALIDDGSRDLAAKRNARMIQEGLARLDDEHRAVVVLFYFEDLKISEIKRVLEIPEGTVKSRLHAAKQTLKAFLAGKGVEL